MKKIVCDICGSDIGDTSLVTQSSGEELEKLDPKDWNKILMKGVTDGKTKLNLDVCNACNVFIRYILTHLKEPEIEMLFKEFVSCLKTRRERMLPMLKKCKEFHNL